MGEYGIYKDNDKIPFTVRVTGTTETQVFVVPYGLNIRFKIDKVYMYNEAGTATTVKIFDHVTAGGVTDPPNQGDATTPLKTVFLPANTNTTTLPPYYAAGTDQLGELNFQQGMAVVASQATVDIEVIAVEA